MRTGGIRISGLIASAVDDVQHAEKGDVDAKCGQRDRDASTVVRLLTLEEGLWRDYIAHAVRGEEHGARYGLLRVAGNVAGEERVNDCCGGGDHGNNEDSGKVGALGGVLEWNAVEDDARDDAWNVAEYDHHDSLSLSPFCGEEGGNQEHGGRLDHARGYCEQHCLIGRVAETFDDDAGEIGLERIGHVVAKDGEDKHPDFRVTKGFFDLLGFVVTVLDASFVTLQSFDCDQTLAFGQERSIDRGVREEPPEADAKQDSEDAKENEHPLVWKHIINLCAK